MKITGRIIKIVALAAILFHGVVGCSGTGNSETELVAQKNQTALEVSQQAWVSKKSSLGDIYTYSVSSSSWIGFQSRTDVTVENNQVVQRVYFSGVIDDSGSPQDLEREWTEVGDAVGTEPGAGDPLTIDEIYQLCETEVLIQSPEENYISLSFNADGVLRHCSYSPKSCQDDCSRGYNIQDIREGSAISL